MDKLTMHFLHEMVALQLLQNMEYLERSSRKRKHADLDDDNKDDDDEEDEDEEDEEDNDNEEEDDEESSDVPGQTSANNASDARSSTNLTDASFEVKALKLEEKRKELHEILDKMKNSPTLVKIATEELCEFTSKLSKQVAKVNGTNGK